MIQELTDSNFQTEVLQSDKLAVILFFLPMDPPSNVMMAMLNDLSRGYDGTDYDEKFFMGKVEVLENPAIEKKWKININAVPEILFIKNGNIVDRLTGLVNKGVVSERIKEKLYADM